MSSWSSIKVGGMEVHGTQNYYHEWFFRKSERVIETFPAKEYYEDPERPEEETVTVYRYKIPASTLRRRLDLAGFNRQSLEKEFKEQNEQQINDCEELAKISSRGIERFIPVLKAASLNDWLARLKTIHEQKLEVTFMPGEKKEYADELLNFMLEYDALYTDYPTAGGFNFPCRSIECYAVALLEFLPDTSECVLDVTDLVNGGWTDAFDDLVEYHQDFTTFYQVFSTSVKDIKSLIALAPTNGTLARLLYASVITAMETYLSDTMKKQVLNREAIKRRFVRSHDYFQKEKFTVAAIFDKFSTLKTEIVTEIDKMSFHNLDRIPGLYKSVLDTEFPTHLLPELKNAIANRHDIVHRNGKSTGGTEIEMSMEDVKHLIELVDAAVKYIDKQIKDGLLDEIDMAPSTSS